MHEFELKLSGHNIPVKVLKHMRYRRFCMKVSEHGVRVTVPFFSTDREWKKFINKNTGWILKKYAQQRSKIDSMPRLVDGGKIPFKGEFFPVSLRDVKKVEFDGTAFVVPNTEDKELLLSNWYIQEAADIVMNLIDIWQQEFGKGLKEVKLKNMTSRWGSCTAKGIVSLNWRLIMAAETVFEYVFIHELCHLQVKSHGPEFWALVEKEIPHYKKHRTWLRKNGFMLTNFPEPVKRSSTVAKVRIS